ncbi:MAG: glycosyltransferase [Microcoleaceae cyanobacterium]
MTSGFSNQRLKHWVFNGIKRPATATILGLALITLMSAISIGWFAGEATLTEVFNQLHQIQQSPPFWLEIPDITQQHLFLPTVGLGLIVFLVMKISPQPDLWSRVIVVSVLLAVTLRYFLWRSLSTLNLADPLNGILSLAILLMEIVVIFSNSLQVYHSLKIKKRHNQADQMSVAVVEGKYQPSVDILIPTYNEPVSILRRTIIGCQAIDYVDKTIYLLDDTRRPEVRKIADELGCEYITRPDNRHAKAGNLNHAISQTHGELIVVFDADFVPTTNFLTRTLGFFQDSKIALLQTHQSFYNADPVARNLGLEDRLPQEVEIFSRHYQLLRDGLETALCYGSSFVVRRSALLETGGFVTESLSEDYYTGIRLSAKGYRVIYLGESLSAGLSAENMSAHVIQRMRWARGTLQAFFVKASPFIIPGLKPKQRLAHFEGIIQWFTSVFRLFFLILPIICYSFSLSPIHATATELIYFFLPYYLIQLFTFSWLNYRSRSALISDIYSIAQCFPVSIAVFSTLTRPFSKPFKVTPKGVESNRFYFNLYLAWPLILILIGTIFCLWKSWNQPSWVLFWSIYNIFMISVSLLILLDAPRLSVYEWFQLRRVMQVKIDDQTLWGVTTKLSEIGAEIALTQQNYLLKLPIEAKQTIELELSENQLKLTGKVINYQSNGEYPILRIEFENVTLPQHRELVKLLFCRPGQWQAHQTPGELKSIQLLLTAFFKPRFIFDRHREDHPMFVSQS